MNMEKLAQAAYKDSEAEVRIVGDQWVYSSHGLGLGCDEDRAWMIALRAMKLELDERGSD